MNYTLVMLIAWVVFLVSIRLKEVDEVTIGIIVLSALLILASGIMALIQLMG